MVDEVEELLIHLDKDYKPQEFRITREEGAKLLEYFLNCGYIGFKLERDLATHKFIKRLEEFLK